MLEFGITQRLKLKRWKNEVCNRNDLYSKCDLWNIARIFYKQSVTHNGIWQGSSPCVGIQRGLRIGRCLPEIRERKALRVRLPPSLLTRKNKKNRGD